MLLKITQYQTMTKQNHIASEHKRMSAEGQSYYLMKLLIFISLLTLLILIAM